MMLAIMASSLKISATNSYGPDDPDKTTTVGYSKNVPSSALPTFGTPSPAPVKAPTDQISKESLRVSKPILSLTETSYEITSAAPIPMASKAMPSTFKGCASNDILGWQNLNDIFRQISKGQKTIKILQIGDSHVRGNIWPQTMQKSLESKFNDAQHKSVSFDFIGINGARASKFTSQELLGKISAKHPDLVIISFGTNEAHGNFSSASNRKVMDNLVSSIRRSNPNVTFLITTTPGSYISRGGSKVVNKTHEDVARNLVEFGQANGIAVWDMYHNLGGNDHACQNLINAKMMQNDRIHLTASGYRMIGEMFSEAFINAYNKSLRSK